MLGLGSRLSSGTDYYLDGVPVVKFEKIEFSAWGETELPTERILTEYVVPHLKGERADARDGPSYTRAACRAAGFHINPARCLDRLGGWFLMS